MLGFLNLLIHLSQSTYYYVTIKDGLSSFSLYYVDTYYTSTTPSQISSYGSKYFEHSSYFTVKLYISCSSGYRLIKTVEPSTSSSYYYTASDSLIPNGCSSYTYTYTPSYSYYYLTVYENLPSNYYLYYSTSSGGTKYSITSYMFFSEITSFTIYLYVQSSGYCSGDYVYLKSVSGSTSGRTVTIGSSDIPSSCIGSSSSRKVIEIVVIVVVVLGVLGGIFGGVICCTLRRAREIEQEENASQTNANDTVPPIQPQYYPQQVQGVYPQPLQPQAAYPQQGQYPYPQSHVQTVYPPSDQNPNV